jgi:hypothetical protein
MTPLDVIFHFENEPGEAEARALHEVREVYGIRQLRVDTSKRSIRVEYDASRLTVNDVAALLREAGIDLSEPVPTGIPLAPLVASI